MQEPESLLRARSEPLLAPHSRECEDLATVFPQSRRRASYGDAENSCPYEMRDREHRGDDGASSKEKLTRLGQPDIMPYEVRYSKQVKLIIRSIFYVFVLVAVIWFILSVMIWSSDPAFLRHRGVVFCAVGLPVYVFWLLGWHFLYNGPVSEVTTPKSRIESLFMPGGLKIKGIKHQLAQLPKRLRMRDLPPGRYLDLITIFITVPGFFAPSFEEASSWRAKMDDDKGSKKTVGTVVWHIGHWLPAIGKAFLFEFSRESFRYTFPALFATCVIGFVILFKTQGMGALTRLFIIQLFSDTLSGQYFGMIFNSMSCTFEEVDGLEKAHLDAAPTIICWTPLHLYYFIPSMLIFVPYYIFSLFGLTVVQATQTVVLIDPLFFACRTQMKMLVSLFKANFGKTWPRLILSVLLVNNVLLFLLGLHRRPHSIDLLNKAEHNGMFFATWSVMLSLLSYQLHHFSEASNLFLFLYYLGVTATTLFAFSVVLRDVWGYGRRTGISAANDVETPPGYIGSTGSVVVIDEPEYPPVKRRCAEEPNENWTESLRVEVHDNQLYPVEALTWKHLHTYTFGHLEVNIHNFVTLDGLSEAFPQILRQKKQGCFGRLTRTVERAQENCHLWIEHNVLKRVLPAALFTNIDLQRWGMHAEYDFTIKFKLLDQGAHDDLIDWLESVCMPNLICLEMTHIDLRMSQAVRLAKLLYPNEKKVFLSGLKTLNLEGNNLCHPIVNGDVVGQYEVAGIDALRSALGQETACVRSVNLLRNQLTPADAKALLEVLARMTPRLHTLCGFEADGVELNLAGKPGARAHAGLGPGDARMVAAELSGAPPLSAPTIRSLTALDLSHNSCLSMEQDGFDEILGAAASIEGLQRLSLAHMQLQDRDAEVAARQLGHMRHLRDLDVSHNLIGPIGGRQLATAVLEALRRERKLETFCGVPVMGLLADATAVLDLRHQGIGVPGALVLSELLAKNANLSELLLSHNNLSSERGDEAEWFKVFRALGGAVGGCAGLKLVDLKENAMMPQDLAALLDGGALAGGVEQLDLSGNWLCGVRLEHGAHGQQGGAQVGTYDGDGIHKLGTTLVGNESLRCLVLNSNFIGQCQIRAEKPQRQKIPLLCNLPKIFSRPDRDKGTGGVDSASGGQPSECCDAPIGPAGKSSSEGPAQEEACENAAVLQAFAENLAKSRVSVLHMLNNSMSPKQVLAFTERLTQCRTLQKLNISGGWAGDSVKLLSTQLESRLSIKDGEGERELEVVLEEMQKLGKDNLHASSTRVLLRLKP